MEVMLLGPLDVPQGFLLSTHGIKGVIQTKNLLK